MLSLYVFALCLFGLLTLSLGNNPGLKLRLSQTGLNYALDVGVDVLAARLSGSSIPDQSGETSIGVGKVHWTISGMRITSFGKPKSSISVNPGHGLSIRLSGGNIAIHGDWNYKVKILFPIKDHGSFDISASNIGIDLSLSLGKTSTGKPNIWTTGCSSTLSDVRVKFHGGASWIYNLFSKGIESKLKKSLRNQLCDQATKAVNENARKSLETLPTSISVENVLDLDYSLISDVLFASGYMESYHKGEFYWHGSHTESPYTAPAMPSLGQPSGMVQICVSSYVLDTLGYVLQKHQLIQYTLSKSDLPPSSQGMLNTTCQGFLPCIGGVIPKLSTMYPNKSVRIKMEATIPPRTTFLPGKVEIHFYGNFKYEVEMDDKTTKYLFATSVNATVNGTGGFIGNMLTGNVSAISPVLKVTDTAIGPVPAGGLTFLFKAASSFIIPKLNEIGKKGLVIPTMKHVEFTNPHTKILQDVVVVSTDVKYKPDTNLYFVSNVQ